MAKARAERRDGSMGDAGAVGVRPATAGPHGGARERATRNGAVVFTAFLFAVGFLACCGVWYAVAGTVGLAALVCATVVGFLLASSLHVVMEWERAVVMRFGRFNRVAGPGLVFTIPLVEFCAVRVDQRVAATYFGAEETLTRDLVSVNVDAVIFWMVFSPKKAAVEVEDYASAVSWMAQTTLRAAIGRVTISEVASRRDDIDAELREILTDKLGEWGVEVLDVQVRDIVLPHDLQLPMSAASVAEREREARMTLAEAENDIAAMMSDAAGTYGEPDAALRLRTMHLAYESAKASNGTVVLPSEFADGFVEQTRA